MANLYFNLSRYSLCFYSDTFYGCFNGLPCNDIAIARDDPCHFQFANYRSKRGRQSERKVVWDDRDFVDEKCELNWEFKDAKGLREPSLIRENLKRAR